MEEALESVGKKLKETVLQKEKLETEKLYNASVQCVDNQLVDPQQDLQSKEPARNNERTAQLINRASLRRVGANTITDYDVEKHEDHKHAANCTSDDLNNAEIVSLEEA